MTHTADMSLNRTELKVRAAALATFIASSAGVVLLQALSPAWIEHLPLWLQAPAAGLVLAGVAWLAGRRTKTRPDYLSQSTIDAAELWLQRQAGRRGTEPPSPPLR